MNEAPHSAVDFIIKNAPKYGKAKGHRIQIEEFRKSKKSLLMKDALLNGFEAANAQEREAYANQEYIELISGLAAAVEEEETLKWQMEAAKMRVEIWRTEQANNRTIDRSTQ
jgi:hypothetical protein